MLVGISEGDFPQDFPNTNGGIHIALFMKWCLKKGWAGERHLSGEPEDTNKVINGELSATEFFFKYCDGKLTDEDFNDEGNKFACEYYGEDGFYLDDYTLLLGNVLYKLPEDEHDFDKLSHQIENRYVSNTLSKKQSVEANSQERKEDKNKLLEEIENSSKPWWKFW